MSRAYQIGYKVKIIKDTPSLNSYGQSLGYLINTGSIGIVTGYNDKYNYDDNDDFAQIKILSGDPDLINKEVWVKSIDFKNIIKIY